MNPYKPYNHPSTFSTSSWRNLDSCNTRLKLLFTELAHDGWDMTIVCGHRTEEEQADEVAKGTSELQWPDSRHNVQPSLAVDVAPYIAGLGIPWNDDYDPAPWHMLAGAIQCKAKELGIEIEWGGYWESLVDLPHWQLVT